MLRNWGWVGVKFEGKEHFEVVLFNSIMRGWDGVKFPERNVM